MPRKLLLSATGKPLIQHTYESAASSGFDTYVATSDAELADVVRSFGGEVLWTSPDCATGSDRVAEAARSISANVIVNVQGDEPEVSADAIRLAAELVGCTMATIVTPWDHPGQLDDPSCVKCVVAAGRALYFSREPLMGSYRHVGISAFCREFLEVFARLPDSYLERVENLEQLRALENGYQIWVGAVAGAARGIDTVADYEAFVARRSAGPCVLG